MHIRTGTTVTIHYTLTLADGEILDTTTNKEPLVYIQGEEGLLFDLEQVLEGRVAGETVEVTVPPEDAYGVISEDALITVPLDQLPEEGRRLDAMITAVGPQGQELEGVVRSLDKTTALLDFNHPLAGQAVHCTLTVVRVEEQAGA
ncbi:MAG: FKBP-type peptidyl-prolyl cis-trans isomerase [Desulfobulbus sp.]|jgi:FKBP-type peptidyl-prolyl cis-trans isomerase SlyD